MRKAEETSKLITDITSNPKLSFEERKVKIRSLNLTYEEMEAILFSMCEVWTSYQNQ